MAEALLEKVSAEIDARLNELRPLVAEYQRMLAAASALKPGDAAAAPSTRPASRREHASGNASTGRDARPSRSARLGRSASASPARLGRPAGKGPSEGPGERAPRGAAQHAIIAALEHGSHTVSELTVVTAMSGANIRENLRRLQKASTVTRAKRDGKAAYALAR